LKCVKSIKIKNCKGQLYNSSIDLSW
jgi:hypothetical protein